MTATAVKMCRLIRGEKAASEQFVSASLVPEGMVEWESVIGGWAPSAEWWPLAHAQYTGRRQ